MILTTHTTFVELRVTYQQLLRSSICPAIGPRLRNPPINDQNALRTMPRLKEVSA